MPPVTLRTRLRVAASTGLYAGGLVAVAGLLAWATGRPFVFPSLGPTAYVLAATPDAESAHPRRVVLGHAVGVAAGLAAYHALAAGVVAVPPPASHTFSMLRLAVSAVASVIATSAGMVVADAVHPPACATTLIVSLGLLSSPLDGAVILAAVAALLSVHLLGIRSPAITG